MISLPFSNLISGEESGDWFIWGRDEEDWDEVDVAEAGDWLMEGVGRGCMNAPVDSFWSFSKRSCSSFGRRGGEGPPNAVDWCAVLVLNAAARRDSWRGRWVMVRSIVVCVVGF